MAKKNSQKDTSGMVFDTNLKMVMSQGGTFERMKEKVRTEKDHTPKDFSLGLTTFQLH
ncbi:Spermatogenesis-associated serine-rich protein 2 [Salmo salar]|uniref:Spermatogenesis-associated serine-rich protein 2 n=1 Tax=Salmo salar TaxID=8030 RepID=B9EM25_SALSA|nr:Spermatogenesis-associated serine-rich protein 2 [Salmo salar]ACM08572.1 Spermatogenesis-associated serine-rich protein 2 [Salmo salar]ACM09769.1 Spermatogenesis-associated serine-rich protein 2 [Salmo salar]|eukprot:NP_001139900.1 Spermatogenesis-associated serine-rich protein 2 [Salmo salar]